MNSFLREDISRGKEGTTPGITNTWCMKLTRTNNKSGKATLRISKNEWLRLGQDAGWEIPEDVLDGTKPQPDPPFKIEVRKYSDRTWAVYLKGELLCVTVYKKGALAVESTLGELAKRIQEAEGLVRMVG